MSETRDSQPDAITPDRLEEAGMELPNSRGLWLRGDRFALIGVKSTGHLSAECWTIGARSAFQPTLGWWDVDCTDFPRGNWTPAAPAAERVREEEAKHHWIAPDNCHPPQLWVWAGERDESAEPIRRVREPEATRIAALEADLAALREQNERYVAMKQQLAVLNALNAKGHEDYKIQNACIADQHDELAKLRSQNADLEQQLAAARGERGIARAAAELAVQELPKAMKGLDSYVEQYGVEHDDEDCPEDDTCECESVAGVNGAFNRMQMVLSACRAALVPKALAALTKGQANG